MEKEILKQYRKLREFPRFMDGQILSSNELNDSFEYLHNEIRNTRSILFGHGIINGLKFSIEDISPEGGKLIKIEKGKAVTREGDIIDIPETIEFKYVLAREDGFKINGKEYHNLLLEEKINRDFCKSIDEIEDLDNLYLGVFIENFDDITENCNEISCTVNKTSTKYVCGAFLEKSSEIENKKKLTEKIHIPKLTDIIDSNDLSVFLRNITDYFYENIKIIADTIGNLSDNTPSFNEIKNKLATLVFDTENAAPYLSFLSDLTQALHEYVKTIDKLNTKYSTTNKNTVILGKIGENTDGTSLRAYIETVSDYEIIKNEMKFYRQRIRLRNMVYCFNPTQTPGKKEIDISGIRKNGFLGDRPVPKYYTKTEDTTMEIFEEYWDAHNYRHVDNQIYQGIDNDFKYGNESDVFLINNYSDMPADIFHRKMNEQIDKYNLPILFVRFDLCGKRESFILEKYKKDKDNPIKITKDDIDKCLRIVSEKKFISNLKRKSVLPNIEKILPRISPEKLWEILYKFYRDCDVIKAGNAFSKFKASDLESLRQKIYLLTKENEISSKHKHVLSFIIRSLVYRHREEAAPSHKARNGIEYTGGIHTGNVLVAVCHDNRVLLCLDMNYLDYINHKDDFIPFRKRNRSVDFNKINTCFNDNNVIISI